MIVLVGRVCVCVHRIIMVPKTKSNMNLFNSGTKVLCARVATNSKIKCDTLTDDPIATKYGDKNTPTSITKT